MTARAMPTNCCWPPESWLGYKIFLGDDLKAIQRVGHQALPLAARNVLVGKRQVDVLLHGQIVEQVIALEDHADVSLREFGTLLALHLMHRLLRETSTRPVHWSSRSASTFSSEDFPAPDGPMMVMNSPC